MSRRIELIEDGDGRTIASFRCPGCNFTHGVWVNGGAPGHSWEWNGSVEDPTFTPSVLVTTGHYIAGHEGKCWCDLKSKEGESKAYLCVRCHSFVRDGRIEFLSDCTHALAGQTVDLPELAS